MARGVFDIYQTPSGYTAVDSVVRRQILDALAEGDKGLPELVEITGKSKPTLSATHMKDLISRELVQEAPHPTDGRRKVYTLIAQRIGPSEVGETQLRRAAAAYATPPPLQGRLPLSDVLEVLSSAPPEADRETLMAQGERLGWSLAEGLRAEDVRSLWLRLVRWFEDQGTARVVRLDLEAGVVELELDPRLTGQREHVAAALAGLVRGVVLALELASDVDIVGRVVDGHVVLEQRR